jgi:hypothetical protein
VFHGFLSRPDERSQIGRSQTANAVLYFWIKRQVRQNLKRIDSEFFQTQTRVFA